MRCQASGVLLRDCSSWGQRHAGGRHTPQARHQPGARNWPSGGCPLPVPSHMGPSESCRALGLRRAMPSGRQPAFTEHLLNKDLRQSWPYKGTQGVCPIKTSLRLWAHMTHLLHARY